jgi:hypothetical protein
MLHKLACFLYNVQWKTALVQRNDIRRSTNRGEIKIWHQFQVRNFAERGFELRRQLAIRLWADTIVGHELQKSCVHTDSLLTPNHFHNSHDIFLSDQFPASLGWFSEFHDQRKRFVWFQLRQLLATNGKQMK